MADTKISALTDGGRALFDDELVSARGGANRKHDAEDFAGYLTIGHPRRRFWYYSDFVGEPSVNDGEAMVESNNGTGAGTASSPLTATNRPGVFRTTTGSTATGFAAYSSLPAAMSLGAGPTIVEIALNIAALSTSLERYALIVGFFDTRNAADQVDAAAFVYDEGGVSTGSAASANWQLLTSSNSTRTWTTTSTAVPTAYTTLRVEVNAGGTSVEFFVDNVSVGTHTINIPTGTARVLGFGWFLIKSVGTTARTGDFDYLAVEVDFTTAR